MNNDITSKTYINPDSVKDNKKFKNELLHIFRKFGYFAEGKDYEVKIKTTSGNIAWININSIEIIK